VIFSPQHRASHDIVFAVSYINGKLLILADIASADLAAPLLLPTFLFSDKLTEPPLENATAYAIMMLSKCSSVCWNCLVLWENRVLCTRFTQQTAVWNTYTKRDFLIKLSNLELVSINDQLEVLHGLFKELILGPLADDVKVWTTPNLVPCPTEKRHPCHIANLVPCPTANPREKLHPWYLC